MYRIKLICLVLLFCMVDIGLSSTGYIYVRDDSIQLENADKIFTKKYVKSDLSADIKSSDAHEKIDCEHQMESRILSVNECALPGTDDDVWNGNFVKFDNIASSNQLEKKKDAKKDQREKMTEKSQSSLANACFIPGVGEAVYNGI